MAQTADTKKDLRDPAAYFLYRLILFIVKTEIVRFIVCKCNLNIMLDFLILLIFFHNVEIFVNCKTLLTNNCFYNPTWFFNEFEYFENWLFSYSNKISYTSS